MRLTQSRYDTLTFISQGFVKVQRVKDHKGYRFEPREYQVDCGYLERAGLIEVDQEYKTFIDVTAAGMEILASARLETAEEKELVCSY